MQIQRAKRCTDGSFMETFGFAVSISDVNCSVMNRNHFIQWRDSNLFQMVLFYSPYNFLSTEFIKGNMQNALFSKDSVTLILVTIS